MYSIHPSSRYSLCRVIDLECKVIDIEYQIQIWCLVHNNHRICGVSLYITDTNSYNYLTCEVLDLLAVINRRGKYEFDMLVCCNI